MPSCASPPSSATRSALLDLAREGHRAPIGTHLILHRHADRVGILRDGERLGAVIAEAADHFRTPLAMPLMDLTIEKEALLGAFGIPAAEAATYHFETPPGPCAAPSIEQRMRVACDAIRAVAPRGDLVPMGMGIGPFSLMTKLVADPIAPVFLAGEGTTAADEPEVAVVERCLELGLEWVLAYASAQAAAGARALILCEPAANLVYFSPHQLAQGWGVFDRYVMEPLRRIKRHLDALGVELVFHDCGELTDGMVERFASLAPAMLSFGSSRLLWEDVARVPSHTVLYGNLPTKRFVSGQLDVAEVRRLAADLHARMRDTGHPFILGSECDVLSVPGSERAILEKVEAFLRSTP